MRVFIGPMEVAGLGSGWVAGLRALDVHADLVCGQTHRFGYASDPAPSRIARWWAHWGDRRAAVPASRPVAKVLTILAHRLLGWCVLAWAACRYDVFVFLYARTITDTAFDLPLLRLLGRRVVLVFVGSDARPAYIDGHQFPANAEFSPRLAQRATRLQRRWIGRLERRADAVIAARTIAQFLTRPFVNWFAVGIPTPAVTAAPREEGSVIRVLHSPSNPVLKGSAEVQAAVTRLQARGVPIELVTIVGRPNAEVLQALDGCDLVVDQLYSDTPMAAFATEAASLGRPVLVCGCGAAQVARHVGPMPLPPTAYVRPQDFEATLEALATDRDRRQALARECAAFVAEHASEQP